MENLTHSLTGFLIARAGFSGRLPRAALICVLAANAPDVDIVYALRGSHIYLNEHRGFTHGLLAAPVLALLCAIVGRLFLRTAYPWILAFCAALAAVASHLALDWTNIYGIRLLAPFDNHWHHADIASVVDPYLTLTLIAFALWPVLSGLVSQEIGSRAGTGAGAARTALVLVAVYLGARGIVHERALNTLNVRLYDGEEAMRLAAFPHMANPFRWTGMVELPKTYRIVPVNLLAEFDPDAGRVLYKGAEQHRGAIAAARTEPFKALIGFAPFIYWQAGANIAPEDSIVVEANDLRFGLPGEGRFTARAVLRPDLTIVKSEFHFTPQGQLPQPR